MDYNFWCYSLLPVILALSLSYFCIYQFSWKKLLVLFMVVSGLVETGFTIANEVLIGKTEVAVNNLLAASVMFLCYLFQLRSKHSKLHKKFQSQDRVRLVANLAHVIFRSVELGLLLGCKNERSQCYKVIHKYNITAVGPLLAILATSEKILSWKDDTERKKYISMVTVGGGSTALIDNITGTRNPAGEPEWGDLPLVVKSKVQGDGTRQQRITLTQGGAVVNPAGQVAVNPAVMSMGSKADVILVHWVVGQALAMDRQQMKELKRIDSPKILVARRSSRQPPDLRGFNFEDLVKVIKKEVGAAECIEYDIDDPRTMRSVLVLALAYS